MALDLTKLAGQGRAYSGARPWTAEEFEALLALESGRELSRTVAADYIRNGIVTLDAYDAALAASFEPKTLVQAAEESEVSLRTNDFAVDTVVEAPAPVAVADVVPPVEDVPADAPAEDVVASEEDAAPKKTKK